MKLNLFILSVIFALPASACPKISGKFLCPTFTAEPEVLGTRVFQIKKDASADRYFLKLGKESSVFEKDVWKNVVNPTTGDIDRNSQSMATCDGKTVSLKLRTKTTQGGRGVQYITGSFDVTQTAKGISVSLKSDEYELHKFNCVKQ